ncbi:MAG TPA: hypothetical protein EYN79_10815 [Planctomycetes bacterium]|nr:hypothetical protein [Planctomycetota bacterium]
MVAEDFRVRRSIFRAWVHAYVDPLVEHGFVLQGSTAAQAPHSSLAGSGSLPTRAIESRAVAVGIEGLSASDLARRLRTGEPSILPIVRDDTVLLDVRTIAKDEITLVSARVEEIAASP